MLTREAAGISAEVQEKWTHNSGKMPWARGDPSSDVAFRVLFHVCYQYGIRVFLLQGKRFNFIRIYVLLDTETTSVSLLYIIES